MRRVVEGIGPPSLARVVGRLALNSARGAESRRPFPVVERRAIVAEARRLPAYLKATDGARLDGLRGDGAPLPPVYPALWELPMALELFAAAGEGLPRGGVVHLRSERTQVRPLRAGGRVRCRVEVEQEARVDAGVERTMLCRNWTEAGQLCGEDRLVLLMVAPVRAKERAAAPPAADAVPWRELAEWPLRAGHGRRYARVSGDYNPIHLWRWSSRIFGYRRPILHGLCLEAMVAHALVERRLGGTPAALRSLAVRFLRPALLPARLRLLIDETATPRFRIVADDASRPLAEGEWNTVG